VSEASRGVIRLLPVPVSVPLRALARASGLPAALLACALLAGTATARERSSHIRTVASAVIARTAGAKATSSRRADAPASTTTPTPLNARAGRAPEQPPLVGGTGVTDPTGGEEADAGALPQTEADPLVSNGLGSPLCTARQGDLGLSATSRRDCETSGFIAAAAPTGNFGIDVHIDTGLLPFSSGGLLATVQDLFVTPLWMALVWALHALVVMLEWCFTIDLLDSSSVKSGIANGLRQMQAAFTAPWLASVLAVGAVLCAYNGLVRRRVAESLGQVLIALAMIAGGSWVMLDPAGTIGALGAWSNQASLGTLAVTARGTPVGADRALADSMGTVFAAVIEVPWCYLEFGDVGWCRNPARLDPRLHSAALALASAETGNVGCRWSDTPLAACVSGAGGEAKALAQSARLLRAARTNGAVFLALPANGPARNAINDTKSLLRAICQSDEATSCRGASAAQAEFRTNHGTWARVGGLLLIAAGALGILLLLGFVALRLLTAALFSLLYLMLAPIVVLAPALGEGGRAVFRKWAARLLGAVVSKLLFSFLLGAILAILGILANLEALGWWTQWLLMSAFWWGAFSQRHQVLQLATGAAGGEHPVRRRTVLARVNDTLEGRRKALDGARAAKERLAKKAPELGEGGSGRRPGRRVPPAIETTGQGPRRSKSARVVTATGARSTDQLARASSDDGARAPEAGDRLARLRRHEAHALAAGNTSRAVRLAQRAQRIEAEDATGRHEPRHDIRRPAGGDTHDARSSVASTTSASGAGQRLERFLDIQAALPGADAARGESPLRNYAALAGLTGYGRREFERLGPQEMRAARAQIDRELTLRAEQASIVRQSPGTPVAGASDSEPVLPSPTPDRLGDVTRTGGRAAPDQRQRPESELMRDARAVAARRKRQLGRGRP
jgi:hypothetical protein